MTGGRPGFSPAFCLIPPPQKPQELLFSLIAQALFQRVPRVLDGVALLQLGAKRLIGARARFGLQTVNLGIDPRLCLGLQPCALGGKFLLGKIFQIKPDRRAGPRPTDQHRHPDRANVGGW